MQRGRAPVQAVEVTQAALQAGIDDARGIAAELQDDLRRAGIEPFAWVVNASLAAAGPRDPVLTARAIAERARALAVPGAAAIVTGQQAGPGLWQVRNGANTLWILGTVWPLPDRKSVV